MKLLRRLLVLLVLIGMPVAPVHAQQPEQQGEFQPAENLPQRERMPAAPLLISAYAVALVALFGYLVSVSRRVSAVKADIVRLESDVKRNGRA
jgi:hypothetical protein